MPTIVALIVGPEEQQLVKDQLAPMATVRFCDSVDTLAGMAAEHGVQAVVADLRDRSGTSVLPTLALLRRRVPSLPAFLYFTPTPATLREIPDVMTAGAAGLSIVLRGFEHLGLVLRPHVGPQRAPSAADILVRHVVPIAPFPLRPFFLIGALKASPKLRVSTAAVWSRMPRRTLERLLHRAQMPSAATILGSYTGLHAAWWLDVQGWPAKQVVAEMHFSHPSGLTRLLQRYFDCSLTSLRAAGGFQALLFRFETLLLCNGNTPP